MATHSNACETDAPEGGDENTLWQKLWDNDDRQARLRLLALYDPLARQVAASLFAKRPDDTVEFADYLQYARVGLIEAVDRYEQGGQASFRTYATYRIRGAVLNGVTQENDRREQVACRSRLQRERLESLGGSQDKQSEFEHLVDVAIGLALGYILEDTGLIRDESAMTQDNPYRISEYAEVCGRVKKAIDALPSKEAAILKYHYFDDIEFAAIAERLGLSKGRVSQLHKRALIEIRTHLLAAGIDQRI